MSENTKPTRARKIFRRLGRRFTRFLKRFLRACYEAGPRTCLFLAGVFGLTVAGIVLVFTLPKAEENRERAAMALITPTPDPAATIVTDAGDAAAEAAPQAVDSIEPDFGSMDVEAAITPEPTQTPDVRLEKGDQDARVTELQERLMDLGYLALDEPTDYYGNATKYAVELFQRQHELKQDGIAGFETQNLLYSKEAKPYVMYEGAEGDDIKDFQEMLHDLGYLGSSKITGYYGTDTIEAVMKFQSRNHLGKDGKAGEVTLEAINSPDARVSYAREQEIKAEKKAAEEEAKKNSIATRIENFVSIAKDQLGKPYILGAKGPKSFDCSGLVYYCLTGVNVYTRRLNASGFSRTTAWTKITDIDDLKRGDLIFFNSSSSSSVGHVGIYMGSGEMIDASSANGKVVRRSAKTSYWRKHFVCGRRPIE